MGISRTEKMNRYYPPDENGGRTHPSTGWTAPPADKSLADIISPDYVPGTTQEARERTPAKEPETMDFGDISELRQILSFRAKECRRSMEHCREIGASATASHWEYEYEKAERLREKLLRVAGPSGKLVSPPF